MEKERSMSLDIAKGIGIILVVWAHAHGPAMQEIYQFHMPLFFLISGYLFNSRNTVKEFVIRKIHSLYIPFVFWNLCMILFRTTADYLKGSANLVWSGKQVVKVLLLLDKDVLLGATWFLGALFLVSVSYKLLHTLLKPVHSGRLIVIGIYFVFAIIGFSIDLPYQLSRPMILGGFFAVGFLVHEQREFFSEINSPWLALLSFLIYLFIARQNFYILVGDDRGGSSVLFCITALAGSYALICFSCFLASLKWKTIEIIQNGLTLLGRRSIDIVIWHFVFFVPVIVLQLHINGLPVSQALSYGHIYNASHGWWILYTVFGVLLPLLWCKLLRSEPCGKALKFIHAV